MTELPERRCRCCVLGAGPAGLGAALELSRHGVDDILIIDRNKTVGGLSRTEEFGGARFDVGPHRFFTKNTEINQLWHEMLGDDFKPVDRLTRIFYKGKFFNYPIKIFDALPKLGSIEAIQAMVSFAGTLRRRGEPETFEDWITQKFGRKLYETFFKTYTEKVWGIPCSQIGAEWAAQRIKGLDLLGLVKNSLFGHSRRQIKTLVEQFDYPILGAGQMYEAMAEKVVPRHGDLMLETSVVAIHREGERVVSVDVEGADGLRTRIVAEHFLTSIPLTHFIRLMAPQEQAKVLEASDALYYRDHITVNLLVEGDHLFPDQWVYIHAPDVRSARLANYNNFSGSMAGAPHRTALSVEYFVFQHEDLWTMSDNDIEELAVEEVARLGLLDPRAVQRSWVVRETESYPTYYLGFKEPYNFLKDRINQLENVTPIGRGGMYKYNNQDHSLMSGLLGARNYLEVGGAPFDLWEINVDAEYHESARREEDS